MINIKKKAHCSGCHACVNICPKKCIVMETDEEGFWYPSVDLSKCVKCGLCKQVCHHHNTLENHNHPEAYACYTLDDAVRMKSSSGGVFTCLAQEILNNGGTVFGAAFDQDLTVKHIGVTHWEDLEKLRGSKYVQSSIGTIYASVKRTLQSGQLVFFTGTPCQIDGLKLYLGKEYDNLYTADFICHGAPSPKVWGIYLEHMEALYDSKVNKSIPPFFRDKSNGWLGFSMRIHFENGQEYCTPFLQDSYMGAFLSELSLRPSCYHCNSKGLQRNSDITMADCWGLGRVAPDMFEDKGTSLILVNSMRGKKLFDSVKGKIVNKPVSLDIAMEYNRFACISAACPFKRKKFMNYVNKENFENLYRTCANKGVFERIYHKVNRIAERLMSKK